MITNGGNLKSVGSAVTITLDGISTEVLVGVAETFVGTIVFEAYDGTTWVAMNAVPLGGGTQVTSTTTTGDWRFGAAGLLQARARMSAYTSGGALVNVNATAPDPTDLTETAVVGNVATTVADGANVTQGAKADAAATDSTSSWSVVSLLKGIYNRAAAIATSVAGTLAQNLSQIGGNSINTGSGASGTGTQRVIVANDQTAIPIVGYLATPSGNFTRPADTTAYASGDLVANSTTAGSVVPLSWAAARVAAGSFFIRRCRLKKSTAGLTNASFRLHLYGASPTVTNGDNGVWLSIQSSYLGSLDITIDKAFSDSSEGIGAPLIGTEIAGALASGTTIYGLLEARAAYTPGNAEVFTVELEAYQN